MVSGGSQYNVGVTLNVGGVGGGAAGGGAPGATQGKSKVRPKDPDGSKTLKTLTGAGASLTALYKSSTVLQTYQKAMNSIIGVGFDLLFAALSPIFAVLLILMTKLIGWLITSGLLDQIYKASMWIAEKVMALLNWFMNSTWDQIIADTLNWLGGILSDLWEWFISLTWLQWLIDHWISAFEAIETYLWEHGWDIIVGAFKLYITILIWEIKSLWTLLTNLGKILWDVGARIVSDLIAGFKRVLSDIWNWGKEKVTGAVETGVSYAKQGAQWYGEQVAKSDPYYQMYQQQMSASQREALSSPTSTTNQSNRYLNNQNSYSDTTIIMHQPQFGSDKDFANVSQGNLLTSGSW